VPRVVKELLDARLVATPPSVEDIFSPSVMEGVVVEGCPAVVCAPNPPAASAKPVALGASPAAPLVGRPI
jgi:hypothetical protein